MADAWTNLIENSTAPVSSDAWEHLLAQEGGGGEDIVIYLDRYVSDKTLKFKMIDSTLKFDVTPATIKFNTEPNQINFTKEFKQTKIVSKQAKITWTAKRVLD